MRILFETSNFLFHYLIHLAYNCHNFQKFKISWKISSNWAKQWFLRVSSRNVELEFLKIICADNFKFYFRGKFQNYFSGKFPKFILPENFKNYLRAKFKPNFFSKFFLLIFHLRCADYDTSTSTFFSITRYIAHVPIKSFTLPSPVLFIFEQFLVSWLFHAFCIARGTSNGCKTLYGIYNWVVETRCEQLVRSWGWFWEFSGDNSITKMSFDGKKFLEIFHTG